MSTPSIASIIVSEAFKIKVNSKGAKRKKRVCPPGMKVNASGTGCEPIKAQEKQHRRVGVRMARRTVKSQGSTLQRRKKVKTRKAMRFRRSLGLK